MINLIPPDARRYVVREYWYRVATVWLVLGMIAFAIVAILTAPQYVSVSTQLSAYSDRYHEAQTKQEEFKQSEAAIKDTNELAVHLLETHEHTTFNAYIETLDQIAGEAVTLSSFTFTKNEGKVEAVAVVGTAESRGALTSFSDQVETHALFTEAAIPISNLAKDRDITFNVRILTTTE